MKIQSTMRHIALALTILICPATSYSIEPATTFLVGTGIASLALSVAAWWRSGKTVEQPKKSVRINNNEKPKSKLKDTVQKLSTKVQSLELELSKKAQPSDDSNPKSATEKKETAEALTLYQKTLDSLHAVQEEFKKFQSEQQIAIKQYVQEYSKTNANITDEQNKALCAKLEESMTNIKKEFDTKHEEFLKKADARARDKAAALKKMITTSVGLDKIRTTVQGLQSTIEPLESEFNNLKEDITFETELLKQTTLQFQELTNDVQRQLKVQLDDVQKQLKVQSEKVIQDLEDALKKIHQGQQEFVTKEYVTLQGAAAASSLTEASKAHRDQIGLLLKDMHTKNTTAIQELERKLSSEIEMVERKSATKTELKEEVEKVRNWATENFAPKNQPNELTGLLGQVKLLQNASENHKKLIADNTENITKLLVAAKSDKAQNTRGRSLSPSARKTEKSASSSSLSSSSNSGTTYIRSGNPVNVKDSKSHSRNSSTSSTQIILGSSSALDSQLSLGYDEQPSESRSMMSSDESLILSSSINREQLNSVIQHGLDTNSELNSSSVSASSSSAI